MTIEGYMNRLKAGDIVTVINRHQAAPREFPGVVERTTRATVIVKYGPRKHADIFRKSSGQIIPKQPVWIKVPRIKVPK